MRLSGSGTIVGPLWFVCGSIVVDVVVVVGVVAIWGSDRKHRCLCGNTAAKKGDTKRKEKGLKKEVRDKNCEI